MADNSSPLGNPLLTQALALAKAGIHVLPLGAGEKIPLTEHGSLDATTDPGIITGWFGKWPKANIGIALEPSQLMVVGPDTPGWADRFSEKGLPDTATVKSGGGEGHLHYYYRRPEGCPVLRSCVSDQYDIISNGYAVAPPSKHPSGKRYEWLTSPEAFLNGDGTIHLPDAPDWAVAMLVEASRSKAKAKAKAPRERAEPPPRDEDEPPVRLDADAMRLWRGESPVRKPDGDIDASRTLYRIGLALARAGATIPTLIEALRDRDEVLGFAKFYNRKDGGERDYEREARKVWDAVERERPETSDASKSGPINSRDLLWRSFGPTQYVVDKLLPVGSGVLAGKPKIGKSWLALDLALAVATGGSILGYPVTKPRRVLYLALEDNERRLHNRLAKLIYGDASDPPDDEYVFEFQAPPTDNIDFATEWPRMDQGGLERIGEWKAAHKDALIIIDTLQKFRPPSSNRAGMYEDDYNALGAIHQVCRKIGVSAAIVHHTRKMVSDDQVDMVSGSNGITGAVDNILVMQRSRGTADAELFVTGRDTPDDLNLALTFDRNAARWNVLGDAAEVGRSREQQAILDALREAGEPLTPTKIAAALGGEIKANTVTQRLKTMAKQELVRNVGGGKWWIV